MSSMPLTYAAIDAQGASLDLLGWIGKPAAL